MSNLAQAVWVEMLKARRSRMPLLTALGFALIPLVGGFFMIVLKDPALALRVGLISAKARIAMGVADWPTYLNFLTLGTAMGGIVLFGLIAIWVFGREYADRTLKDLLALPTARSAIVLAKFVVVACWSATLTAMICLVGLAIGAAVGLAPVPAPVFLRSGATLAVAAFLSIVLVAPIAFCASAGRGYLPPIGVMLLAMVLGQVAAAAGWGEYFPWSVLGMVAQGAPLGADSYVIVVLTGVAGMIATLLWWELADQPR